MAERGRPSTFTPELAAAVCEKIAGGMSVRAIAEQDGMPGKSTIFEWLQSRAEFADQYARAREAQAEHMQDEILSIADDGRNDSYEDEDGNKRVDQDVIARSRLRVDTRKWLMSKLAPKKYGDKITNEHNGTISLNIIERVVVRSAQDPNSDSGNLPPAA